MVGSKLFDMCRFESEVKAIRLKMDSISGKEEEKKSTFFNLEIIFFS